MSRSSGVTRRLKCGDRLAPLREREAPCPPCGRRELEYIQ